MKKFGKLLAALVVAGIVSLSSAAYAEPKPWIWSWWGDHWNNLDFEPYLENGKHPHNSQWNESNWEPGHWEAQRAGKLDVIQGFYKAGIISDQYTDDDVPVLEVGPSFYMLGGQDKRRVAEMVDYVYGITGAKENGTFLLYDWQSGKTIGAYTRHGLQIQ